MTYNYKPVNNSKHAFPYYWNSMQTTEKISYADYFYVSIHGAVINNAQVSRDS